MEYTSCVYSKKILLGFFGFGIGEGTQILEHTRQGNFFRWVVMFCLEKQSFNVVARELPSVGSLLRQTLERLRQDDQEFKVSVSCIARTKTAWDQKDPGSKTSNPCLPKTGDIIQ